MTCPACLGYQLAPGEAIRCRHGRRQERRCSVCGHPGHQAGACPWRASSAGCERCAHLTGQVVCLWCGRGEARGSG